MTSIAAQTAQIQSSALGQSIGTAVARQQIDAQKAVASLVAEVASAPAPPGQGQLVDVRA